MLITRVSMQIGGELAKGYGAMLGGAVALVATVLAGFQPFLLLVMGVVWWATHNLTFDCTLLDEDQDAGVGLLEQSGLDRPRSDWPGRTARARPRRIQPTTPRPWTRRSCPIAPGWKLWGNDSDKAGRPHAPGVWLIYFAIASLPLFGLGQWLVPAVKEDRRAWLFVYFLAYYRQRHGPAAGDELPQPAALPQTAKVEDAGRDDSDLAIDRRRHDHCPDARCGVLLPLPLSKLGVARESSRDLEPPTRLEIRGAQGQRRARRRGAERGTGRVEISG